MQKYKNGDRVVITEIRNKDMDWLEGEFEELSQMLYGKKGVIIDHYAASPQYNEREAYLVEVLIDSSTQNTGRYELEPDEFIASQETVIQRITEMTKKFNKEYKEYTRISITKQPIRAKEIKDAYGEQIFDSDDESWGWLVFIDPITIANWSHPCEYHFFGNAERALFKKGKWLPAAEIEMEELVAE